MYKSLELYINWKVKCLMRHDTVQAGFQMLRRNAED